MGGVGRLSVTTMQLARATLHQTMRNCCRLRSTNGMPESRWVDAQIGEWIGVE